MTSRASELLEGIVIEDILERAGADYQIRTGSRGEQINIRTCPFCGGDEWKVYVNRETGLGNCFHGSCQQTFNAYLFTKQVIGARHNHEVVSYLEAIARDIGWRPTRARRVAVETTTAADWRLPPSIALPTPDGQNLRYLEARGIGADLAAEFQLRYCHDGWFSYTKLDGSKGGMNFSGRVIIPVFDIEGQMVTFQGRDVTGQSEKRYLFPPTLPGTAAFLYNAHAVVGQKRLILCEGVFDVFGARKATRAARALAEFGVVGSFGIDFSSGRSGADQLAQALRLRQFGLEEINVMWDGEWNAWRKAVDAAAKLARHGIRAFVCPLPAGRDPGEASVAEIERAVAERRAVTPKDVAVLHLRNPYPRG